ALYQAGEIPAGGKLGKIVIFYRIGWPKSFTSYYGPSRQVLLRGYIRLLRYVITLAVTMVYTYASTSFPTAYSGWLGCLPSLGLPALCGGWGCGFPPLAAFFPA